MKFFVTGGAGFIGSNFCDHLLSKGHEVVCFDNFETGQEEFIAEARKNPAFSVVRGDIREYAEIERALKEASPDWVVHMAANADVRHGLENPRRDLDYNTIGTWNVVEAARKAGVTKVLFSSTSAVYADPAVFPTPEDAPFPMQNSLYGASKAAGEGILSSYAFGYGMRAVTFRFVSLIGPRYTHGHIFDFVKKLRANPTKLEILGNGEQVKTYLHINDLMRALWIAIEKIEDGTISDPYTVFNVGHPATITAKESAGHIAKRMGLSPTFSFTGNGPGWVGDARVVLDWSKMRALGWEPAFSLEQGIADTVDYLLKNAHLLEVRA